MAATTSITPGVKPSPWLHGRAVDILCGYGLLYILTLAPLGLFAQQSGLFDWPAGLGALIAMALSTPHYGATLLRVYETKHDRRKYAFFTIGVTAFMLLAFGAGLYHRLVGSLLLTAYVFWSPWHFAGQNFGLAMMSLRRRGLAVDRLGRNLLYASFILSYALALVTINAAGIAFAQGVGNGAVFTIYHLGLGSRSVIPLISGIGAVYLVVTAFALVRLARGARVADLGPTMLLLATHALWFVLPSISMTTRAFGLPPLVFTAIWISAAHSLQYLWVTSYYAARSGHPTSGARFFMKCMLAGSAVVALPPILFAPGLVGSLAPLAPNAVAVLTFSVVNLHHFLLDGAIWKLRDGRVARALLDLETAEPMASDDEPSGGWLRPLFYALGVVGLLFPLYLVTDIGWSIGSGSAANLQATAARFEWLGRENALVFAALGQQREAGGDVEGAIEAYRRAVEIEPQRLDEARRLTALLVATSTGDSDRIREAVEVAENASGSVGHRDPAALIMLGDVRRLAGDPRGAREAYERALAAARKRSDSAAAFESDVRLRQLTPSD